MHIVANKHSRLWCTHLCEVTFILSL